MSLPNSVPPSVDSPSFVVGSGSASGSVPKKGFVDRRVASGSAQGRAERRQFGSSHAGLSDDGKELALAIDAYKIRHHRRYLTCDEMITVLISLGYAKRS